MAFPRKIKDLCTPAFVYFVLSIVGIIACIMQNLGNRNVYRLGSYSTRCNSTLSVFVAKIIYILFWTWILNLICRDGHSGIAWFLVLIPFLVIFVMLGLFIASPFEGMKNGPHNAKAARPRPMPPQFLRK